MQGRDEQRTSRGPAPLAHKHFLQYMYLEQMPGNSSACTLLFRECFYGTIWSRILYDIYTHDLGVQDITHETVN